jgi:GT2 family glycosyltransferase
MTLNFRHSVVICTQSRTGDLLTLINSIESLASSTQLEIIVVENSGDKNQYNLLATKLEQYKNTLNIKILIGSPGLTRSRNLALAKITEGIVHFVDDDLIMISDYFEVADKHFKDKPDLAGIAPYIDSPDVNGSTNKLQSKVKSICIKHLNLEGKLTRSGRAFWLVNPNQTIEVDWLPGCSMSYRFELIGDLRFSECLEKGPLGGYALGEDVDFSSSMKEKGGLEAIGGVTVIHKLALNNRRNWQLMDEGIGRWLAYLQRTKPKLVNKNVVFTFLILDSIKIQLANVNAIFKKDKKHRESLRRLRSYKAEVLNPTLIK